MIKKLFIITIICITLIIPLINISSGDTFEPKNSFSENKSSTLFSTNIDIEIESLPRKELRTGQTTTIPITIIFETNIPQTFLTFIPWQIRNLLLFNQIIPPPATVYLQIENQPDFALFYLSQDTLIFNWASEQTILMQQSSIIITPLKAPKAGPFSFEIKAYCDDFGKISGYETIETITLNSAWEPKLMIKQDDYVLSAPAGSLINTSITVTNMGNDDCLVIAETTSEYSNWSTCMSPSYHLISKNQSETFSFFIGIPEQCINCYRTFQIDFSSVNIPKTNTTIPSDPVFISVFGLEP